MIFNPIPIKIIPPTTSIFFGINCPTCFPRPTPKNEKKNVMLPIIRIGVTIEISNIAKLIPIAKASMLVANDNTSND